MREHEIADSLSVAAKAQTNPVRAQRLRYYAEMFMREDDGFARNSAQHFVGITRGDERQFFEHIVELMRA